MSATFKVTSGPAAFNGDLVGNATWRDGRSASMAERVRNTSPIKINEFRIGSSNPGNGTNSFIELYNAGAGPVDISGWTLTEPPLLPARAVQLRTGRPRERGRHHDQCPQHDRHDGR